jgi:hypothetical protein
MKRSSNVPKSKDIGAEYGPNWPLPRGVSREGKDFRMLSFEVERVIFA